MEKEFVIPVEVNEVNKFDDDWLPETLFEPFRYRFLLKREESYIKNLSRIVELKKMLREKIGNDWIIHLNDEGRHEVYVKNSTFFLQWKLNDSDNFKSWVERVDWHKLS